MNKCPVHKLRADLPPLTPRLAALPVDPERGYPVPYFVKWIDGKPEFRMADAEKLRHCIKSRLCWVCGQPLGKYLAFTIGPMCTVNRTSAEPPEHRDCAEWSVRGCPFLSRPNMERREDELTAQGEANVPGHMIKRNPGVIAIWITTTYKMFPDGQGGALIEIGEPESVSWWREGRKATRAEVEASIQSGIPLLKEKCEGPKDLAHLESCVKRAIKFLPAL